MSGARTVPGVRLPTGQLFVCCPACGHPYEGALARELVDGKSLDPNLEVTHDVTSDGIVWCAVCGGCCGAKVVK